MLGFTSFSAILLTSVSVLLIFFILFFIVIPYKKVCFYKREDAVIVFIPILGFLKTYLRDLRVKGDFLAAAKAFSKEHAHKKLLVSNIGNRPSVVLKDVQYVREFLQKHQYYHKAEYARNLYPLMGSGLILAEGEVWKRHRKIISNSFHYEFLKENIKLIQKHHKRVFG